MLVLACGALALVVVRSPTDEPAAASVEEVLGRWQEVIGSPGEDGVRTFVARSFSMIYFLGDQLAGTPSSTWEYTTWFEAPGRQRVQFEAVSLTRSPGGEGPSSYSQTQVWDGTDHWIDDEHTDGVIIVRRQDPWESVHFGPAPRMEALTSRCRTATVAGEEAIGGRDAWVLELSRPRCGASFPGNDGRSVLWIDRATGVLLRARSYSASGRLWGETEVTLIEINEAIDPALLRFEIPDGVALDDRRGTTTTWGPPEWVAGPTPVSLARASELAAFDILLPARVPAGFERESVEHYWATETARELRSRGGWVRLRYADPNGDWLVIEQGFGVGDYLARYARASSADVLHGVTSVGGTDAQWVDGNPITGWEPGVMTILSIEARRVSGGWTIGPDGGTVFAELFHVALASNRLTLQQLVAVAESLQ